MALLYSVRYKSSESMHPFEMSMNEAFFDTLSQHVDGNDMFLRYVEIIQFHQRFSSSW